MSLKLSDKWKLEGFLESGREHVGKLIDQGNLFDFITNVGVAYFGYRAGESVTKPDDPPEVRTGRGFGGMVTGLVGLRLATTMGGTPPLSQIAGLAILGGIGLIDLGVFDYIEKFKEAIVPKRIKDFRAACEKDKGQLFEILTPGGFIQSCKLPDGTTRGQVT